MRIFKTAALIAIVFVLAVSCQNNTFPWWAYPPIGSEDEIVDLAVTETIALKVGESSPSTVEAIITYESGRTSTVQATLSKINTSEVGIINATASYKDLSVEIEVVVYSAANTASNLEEFTDAISNASENSVIIIDGTVKISAASSKITLDKPGIRIIGDGGKIVTSVNEKVFDIKTNDAVIDGLDFETTATSGETNLINLGTSNGTVIRNCNFSGNFGTNDNTSRGFVIEAGATDFTIEGCTFTNLRQPAYINGVKSGSLINNTIIGTKGWVICQDAELTEISGNKFENNVEDIAIILQNAEAEPEEFYSQEKCLEISKANNNCRIDQQVLNFRVQNGQITSR